MRKGLFSLSYWGPIDYYQALSDCDEVLFEQWESFPKQTFRNRCYIDSPNGRLMLNFPIDQSSKSCFKDCKLVQRENWQQKHWQALQSSYGGSAFFDALAPEIEAFYKKSWTYVLDLNLAGHEMVSNWLRLEVSTQFTESWQKDPEIEVKDFREAFSPKQESNLSFPKYPQVFDHKHGFLARLSILDLIFNEGPASYDYLRSL